MKREDRVSVQTRRAVKRECEVLIIGSGIAGAALAYFLTECGVDDVIVVEREAQAAYHASGRSAASLVELDINPVIQRLKMLGGNFLRDPQHGFSEYPIVDRAGVVMLFQQPRWSELDAEAESLRAEGLALELLTPARAAELFEGRLDAGAFDGAAWLEDGGYIDVHALLSGYISGARAAGAEFRYNSEVESLLCSGGRCSGVSCVGETIAARWVVNAAGAWAGEIAAMAGATPIRFSAKRRCIATFRPPPGVDPRRWPMLWSDPHRFYFRSDSSGVWFCPMDEEEMEAGDPHPDDLAIAAGLDRLSRVFPSLVPRTLGRSWAGLRTFSPDGVPVVGEDPGLPGFFWLAGQGGCGIETSPVLGRVAAELLSCGESSLFETSRLRPHRFLPTRTRLTGA